MAKNFIIVLTHLPEGPGRRARRRETLPHSPDQVRPVRQDEHILDGNPHVPVHGSGDLRDV